MQSHMRFLRFDEVGCFDYSPAEPAKARLETRMHARADSPQEQAAQWPEDIFAILERHDVRQVPYVPDAGHSQLIERVLGSSTMRGIPLTTEEEGVALLAGAWAGGQKGVLLMQSSGVGNCINMLSLTQIFRFPFLTLVTMRGEWGEFNPWQVPMGQTTAETLRLAGVIVHDADEAEAVAPVVEAAGRLAFGSGVGAAVLIGQRLIGTKSFTR
jgi:sulfopyruvate decarboxylase TPP-binding subunit